MFVSSPKASFLSHGQPEQTSARFFRRKEYELCHGRSGIQVAEKKFPSIVGAGFLEDPSFISIGWSRWEGAAFSQVFLYKLRLTRDSEGKFISVDLLILSEIDGTAVFATTVTSADIAALLDGHRHLRGMAPDDIASDLETALRDPLTTRITLAVSDEESAAIHDVPVTPDAVTSAVGVRLAATVLIDTDTGSYRPHVPFVCTASRLSAAAAAAVVRAHVIAPLARAAVAAEALTAALGDVVDAVAAAAVSSAALHAPRGGGAGQGRGAGGPGPRLALGMAVPGLRCGGGRAFDVDVWHSAAVASLAAASAMADGDGGGGGGVSDGLTMVAGGGVVAGGRGRGAAHGSAPLPHATAALCRAVRRIGGIGDVVDGALGGGHGHGHGAGAGGRGAGGARGAGAGAGAADGAVWHACSRVVGLMASRATAPVADADAAAAPGGTDVPRVPCGEAAAAAAGAAAWRRVRPAARSGAAGAAGPPSQASAAGGGACGGLGSDVSAAYAGGDGFGPPAEPWVGGGGGGGGISDGERDWFGRPGRTGDSDLKGGTLGVAAGDATRGDATRGPPHKGPASAAEGAPAETHGDLSDVRDLDRTRKRRRAL